MATSPAILVTMLKLSEPRKERFGTRAGDPIAAIQAAQAFRTQNNNRDLSERFGERMATGSNVFRDSSFGPLMIDTADMFSVPSNTMREIRKRTRDYADMFPSSRDERIARMLTRPEMTVRDIAGHKGYDPSGQRSFFEPAVGNFNSRNYPDKGGRKVTKF